MDKKTIIAIAISTAIFLIWMGVVQPLVTGGKPFSFGIPAATPLPLEPSPAQTTAPQTISSAPLASIQPVASASPMASAKPVMAASGAASGTDIKVPNYEETYRLETDLVSAVFTNKGGQLLSLKLKKHRDKGEPVEMILGGDAGSYFFGTSFGDYGTTVSNEFMNAKILDEGTIEFSRTYFAPGVEGESLPFNFKKRFSFKPGEYVFEFQTSIENSVNAVPNLSNKGYAYTLFLGPQLGPKFGKISNYEESRKYYTFANGKRGSVGLKPKSVKTVKDRVLWASVVGKYFSLVAIPDATAYSVVYNGNLVEGLPTVSQLSFSRPPVTSSSVTDTFRFYIGPNQAGELGRYNDSRKNSYGYSDLKISQIVDANPLFGWLEWLLKKAMVLFHMLIPNWGIAIILVTILVKVVFFPLTLKGSISMAKMADLQPKMAELQAKYKDKPDKLNQEMMEFYKKEGYNPLSGCLPMLIQIPIFLAMYNLFNTHFDLRGALFIPGWIPDLSRPDTILNFDTINLVIWKISAIRLLPIIYVVSQLFYGKFTQTNSTATSQNAMQMKMMLYGMPIFFFFVLYDAPSGLLVYWITSNILTIGQQVITNRIIHQRKSKQGLTLVSPQGSLKKPNQGAKR